MSMTGFDPAMAFAETTANNSPQPLDAMGAASGLLSGGRPGVARRLAEDCASLLSSGDGARQVGAAGITVRHAGFAIGTESSACGRC